MTWGSGLFLTLCLTQLLDQVDATWLKNLKVLGKMGCFWARLMHGTDQAHSFGVRKILHTAAAEHMVHLMMLEKMHY